MMKAFKLLTVRKNGTLGSLFINKAQVIPIGEWLPAENHPTKKYRNRAGWHALMKPHAPHLSQRGRVWAMIEVSDFKMIERPKSQGGKWVLANAMKVIKTLETL